MNKILLFLVLASAVHAPGPEWTAVSKKFVAAFNQGDPAGVAALYAEDAVLTTPGGKTVRGRKAIQDVFAGDAKNMPGAQMTFSGEEFRPLSPTAVVWRCEWEMKFKEGGNAKGTGLAVLAKVGAEWLMVEDLAAMTPAAPAPK